MALVARLGSYHPEHKLEEASLECHHFPTASNHLQQEVDVEEGVAEAEEEMEAVAHRMEVVNPKTVAVEADANCKVVRSQQDLAVWEAVLEVRRDFSHLAPAE